MIDLEITQLRSGSFVCRPKGACGTIGWYPIAWTMAHGKTPDEARQRFLNWHRKELAQLLIDTVSNR